MRLGAHIGIADGLPEAVATAKEIGCASMQIFSKSPQMWKGPPVADEAAAGFRAAVTREGIGPNAIHHGYLINLASPKPPMLRQSRVTFLDELERAEKLGVDYLIFHPGAHLGSGPEAGLKTLVESLNGAFEKTAGFRVRALIENAAGQGTAMCSTFEEVAGALDGVTDRSRIGVAIDTCHLFASGIDFRTEADYGTMVDRLSSIVGTPNVFAFHLNDAKAELGSHLDRHENIGKGKLGLDGFGWLLNDRRWKEAPGYLETPLTDDDYGAYRDDL
ncbi:MAG: deoxyribonuclease IV, partial [Thermoplasmata archaeon]|nr:deoxyribonuclease IV [Thermoplasmata archaeon]